MFSYVGRGGACSSRILRTNYNLSANPISCDRNRFRLTKASLREGGGTRSVTEGAYATYMSFDKNYCDALSLTRLRRELPPGGSLFCPPQVCLFFLTSTALVSTSAKYGIPLSRYAVFLQNAPLGSPLKLRPFLLYASNDSTCGSVQAFCFLKFR